eukprot:TRINITY_DN5893_c0_g1_i1.p1 TRINITY_DN5893_c0_g1~~TRINITY_DN5893_c0_g1_i1.p1  ORF type:complete len:332 (-),score=70.16 TRINITY_DN5893_c0_g1_i1:64-1005(-)
MQADGQAEPSAEVAKEHVKADVECASRSRSRSRARRSSRSSSSSSSSKSSSRSGSRHSRSQSPPTRQFVCGDQVKVDGIESESGRWLNGYTGVITQYIEAERRYEVSFGPDRLVRLRADKLQPCKPSCEGPLAAQTLASVESSPVKPPAAASLASLLGLGRAKVEEEKPAGWQSVWQRSAADAPAAPAAGITEEQQQVLREMQAQQEQQELERQQIRRRVEAELASIGVHDEAMIEQALQEQLEKHRLDSLLRGESSQTKSQAKPRSRVSGRSRSRSGSSRSSGTSLSSRGGSRSRSRARSNSATQEKDKKKT